jgi:hypothetical protein
MESTLQMGQELKLGPKLQMGPGRAPGIDQRLETPAHLARVQATRPGPQSARPPQARAVYGRLPLGSSPALAEPALRQAMGQPLAQPAESRATAPTRGCWTSGGPHIQSTGITRPLDAGLNNLFDFKGICAVCLEMGVFGGHTYNFHKTLLCLQGLSMRLPP